MFPHFKEKTACFSPLDTGATWTKLNPSQLGYYRVNYPAEDWAAFTQLLADDANALPAEDRASLINDAFR